MFSVIRFVDPSYPTKIRARSVSEICAPIFRDGEYRIVDTPINGSLSLSLSLSFSFWINVIFLDREQGIFIFRISSNLRPTSRLLPAESMFLARDSPFRGAGGSKSISFHTFLFIPPANRGRNIMRFLRGRSSSSLSLSSAIYSHILLHRMRNDASRRNN